LVLREDGARVWRHLRVGSALVAHYAALIILSECAGVEHSTGPAVAHAGSSVTLGFLARLWCHLNETSFLVR